MPRLPTDSFERFLALGPTRSYAKLALALGVSKRSIVARASREGWQLRLLKIEEAASRKHDEDAAEQIDAIDSRHLKVLRVIQGRALQGLQQLALTSGVDCVRALVLAIKAERMVLGPRTTGAKEDTLAELIQKSWTAPRVEPPCHGMQPLASPPAGPAPGPHGHPPPRVPSTPAGAN